MQQIVIVGGGFAGFWAAMGAARVRAENGAEFAIALISRDPRLVLVPRLYEQAPDRLAVELPPLLAAVDVGFTLGEVTGIVGGAVTLADGRRIGFDRLVLAAGSVARPPEIPGFAEHGLMLDTLQDAERLQRHLSNSKSGETGVVIGAGFTGVEIAAELAPRFRVVLVERAARLAASLGDGPRPASIAAALNGLGVETRLGCGVTAVTAEAVTLSTGERIATGTAIWAGGLAASPLTAQIDARDATGRFQVDAFLGVPGHPALFAAGDVASANAAGHQTLMSCQHAMPLGRVAGHNAARHLLGLEMTPFSAPAYVTCLDLGDAGAMLSVGWERRVVRTGAEAKIVKRTINGLRILPPPAEREALLAAAALNSGQPTEAGMLAYFDQLIASQRGGRVMPAAATRAEAAVDALAEHRRTLWRIAYRMLGSASDADDVLQEVAIRWLAVDRATLHQPRGWLIAVCSRLCIDLLRRQKRARDAYVGPWLPEPVADDRADDLSLGYLLLLQRLQTSERTVLVLHEAVGMSHGEIGAVLGRSAEACRKALSRAKRRIQAASNEALRPVAHARVAAFRDALRAGDPRRLMALLAEDAVLLSDGGGKVVSALRPIRSADRIARFLAGIWRKRGAGLTPVDARINGADGLLWRADDGTNFGLMVPEAPANGPFTRILVLRNPDKLGAYEQTW